MNMKKNIIYVELGTLWIKHGVKIHNKEKSIIFTSKKELLML